MNVTLEEDKTWTGSPEDYLQLGDEMDVEEEACGSSRVISVGFIRPFNFEGDTIYVNLKYKEGSFVILAEAESDVDFKYEWYKGIGKLYDKIGTTANNSNQDCDSPYRDFIGMLAEKNDAVVSEKRILKDGLKLERALRDIKSNLNNL